MRRRRGVQDPDTEPSHHVHRSRCIAQALAESGCRNTIGDTGQLIAIFVPFLSILQRWTDQVERRRRRGRCVEQVFVVDPGRRLGTALLAIAHTRRSRRTLPQDLQPRAQQLAKLQHQSRKQHEKGCSALRHQLTVTEQRRILGPALAGNASADVANPFEQPPQERQEDEHRPQQGVQPH